jgi:ComF family protein
MDDPGSVETLSNPGARRHRALAWLFDQLLPRHCVLCGQRPDAGFLCVPCLSELPWSGPACPRCGIETPAGQCCGRCLRRPPAFDATVAAFRYGPPLDRLIQGLKYAGDLSVARALGSAMAQVGRTLDFDVIVPVPLHRARLAERGYNQSLELARPLGRAAGRPLWIEALERVRQTPAQAGLSLRERRRNLRGAFAARRRFDGLRVLVVDDVMTSGATLDALARCLRQAGATAVTNLVCARTPADR